MQVFMQPLEQLGEFDEIRSRLVKNRGILQVSGCVESQKAHMMYGLFEALKKDRKQGCNCLIIAENDLKAKELYEDYRLYNRDVYFYPARDLIFFQADIHGNLLTRERMQVIVALLEKKNITVITTMSGCMDYLLPLDVLGQHTLSFKTGSPLDMEKLKLQLRGMGYERDVQAETPGQFSFRGALLTFFLLQRRIQYVLNCGEMKLTPSEALMGKASVPLKIWRKSLFIRHLRWFWIKKCWKKV